MSIEITGLDKVLEQFGDVPKRIETAARAGIDRVALTAQTEARQLLNNNPHKEKQSKDGKSSWSPPGHIGGPGSPPNRRSGHLRDSIAMTRRVGLGTYEVDVMPGMIYARRLEVGINYPYMKPTMEKLKPRANQIFRNAFMRSWRS